MADIAFGSVGKIVEIALKIKEAVETVKQNEKECRDFQRCVARVSALLRKLDEMTEMMKDEVMRDALEDLAESLQRALELITECQRKHIFRRFLVAGDMAKELGQVQDDIVRKLQLGNFATNVQITIMVTNIQSAGGPPPPPLPAPRQEIIDGFTMFSLSELKDATENFSYENNIGSGSFSAVYQRRSGMATVAVLVTADTAGLYDYNYSVDKAEAEAEALQKPLPRGIMSSVPRTGPGGATRRAQQLRARTPRQCSEKCCTGLRG